MGRDRCSPYNADNKIKKIEIFSKKKPRKKKFKKNLELESDWIRPSPLFFNILFFYRERCNIWGGNFFMTRKFFGGNPHKIFVSPFLFSGCKIFLTPRVFFMGHFQIFNTASIFQFCKTKNLSILILTLNAKTKKNSLGCSRQKK